MFHVCTFQSGFGCLFIYFILILWLLFFFPWGLQRAETMCSVWSSSHRGDSLLLGCKAALKITSTIGAIPGLETKPISPKLHIVHHIVTWVVCSTAFAFQGYECSMASLNLLRSVLAQNLRPGVGFQDASTPVSVLYWWPIFFDSKTLNSDLLSDCTVSGFALVEISETRNTYGLSYSNMKINKISEAIKMYEADKALHRQRSFISFAETLCDPKFVIRSISLAKPRRWTMTQKRTQR